jgi:hypothetical protein
VKTDYGTGEISAAVAIGELNGDGKSDLATASWASYRSPCCSATAMGASG